MRSMRPAVPVSDEACNQGSKLGCLRSVPDVPETWALQPRRNSSGIDIIKLQSDGAMTTQSQRTRPFSGEWDYRSESEESFLDKSNGTTPSCIPVAIAMIVGRTKGAGVRGLQYIWPLQR